MNDIIDKIIEHPIRIAIVVGAVASGIATIVKAATSGIAAVKRK